METAFRGEAEACRALIVQPLAHSHGVLAYGRVGKPFAYKCWPIRPERRPKAAWICTDRWPTSARVGKPKRSCSQATTTTPMGRLFYHIIGSFVEFERALIVERVRAGFARAKAKGMVLGRPERDPSARARIVALRAQGLSLRAIARREQRSPAGVLKILRQVGQPHRPPSPQPV